MFRIFSIVLRYLPLILEGVIAVENVLGAGKGKAKKQLVMNVFDAAAHVGEQSDDKVVAAVSKSVDLVVDTLNQAGVFAKSEPAK